MADLGEFGRAVADYHGDEDTFRFRGERFVVPALLSDLVLMEFTAEVKRLQRAATDAEARRDNARAVAARAATAQEREAAEREASAAETEILSADSEGTEAQYAFIRGCIGDGQWRRFRDVAVRAGVGGDELMDVCARIYEAVAGRPTRRPSDSSDGPSSTGDGSTASSASPEPTGGPARPAADSSVILGEVIELSPAQRQQMAFRAQMVPVEALLTRSGG